MADHISSDELGTLIVSLKKTLECKRRLQESDHAADEENIRSLLQTISEEQALVARIVQWQPETLSEAETKLWSLIAYLAATRSSFDEETLRSIIASIRDIV